MINWRLTNHEARGLIDLLENIDVRPESDGKFYLFPEGDDYLLSEHAWDYDPKVQLINELNELLNASEQVESLRTSINHFALLSLSEQKVFLLRFGQCEHTFNVGTKPAYRCSLPKEPAHNAHLFTEPVKP